MTDAQIAALRTALLADTDPNVQAAVTARNDTEVARLYNLPSTFIVWRTVVLQDEITQNGFAWVEVDNLSVGKARIWEWLFLNQTRSINPSRPNVRAGIAECWSGNAARLAVQAVVLGHCKRPATFAERVFASGTGTNATPGDLGSFVGSITINDVGQALNG